ncbi:MAG: D-lyxose/D-mannose family sugar isomerase [Armatimonadetes bacterium]|nr:D-lyxose/D-mannose family sugar isomerase [Armatimonadota bacterium]
MKRSDINLLARQARACFEAHGWALPPQPRWDVCDFGMGDVWSKGLLLINLAEEPEYCEKLMYQRRGMVCLAHTHKVKKEDIICRWGELAITVWPGHPRESHSGDFSVNVNAQPRTCRPGERIVLEAGERVTLVPGIYHAFEPASDEVIIGEVSTANDDLNDNFFADEGVGRFPTIEEDEPAEVRLLSEG